jgi:hypothetical protein
MFQASISYFSTPAQDINTQDDNLLIYFGTSLFSYVITNEENKIIAFEKYNINTSDRELLHSFFEAKQWLNNSYKNIKIAFGTKEVTLVPDEFFNTHEIEHQLTILYGDVGNYISFNEPILNHKAKAVYRIEKETAKAVLSKYAYSERAHFESLVISQALKEEADQFILSIHILEDVYTLALVNQQKLVFGKTYHFETNEHLVFCLLSICKMNAIDPAEMQIRLSGWVSMESALYKELYKYFTEISFEKLAMLSIESSEYEAHYFKPFELIQSL